MIICYLCVHFKTLDKCFKCVKTNYSYYKERKQDEYSNFNGAIDKKPGTKNNE